MMAMIANRFFAPKNSSLEEIYLREGMRQIGWEDLPSSHGPPRHDVRLLNHR